MSMEKWPLTGDNTSISERPYGFRKILMLTIPREIMKDRPILFGDISPRYPKYLQIIGLFFKVCQETLHYRGRKKHGGGGGGNGGSSNVSESQLPNLAVTRNPTAEQLDDDDHPPSSSSSQHPIDPIEDLFGPPVEMTSQEPDLLAQVGNLPYGGSDFAQQDVDEMRQASPPPPENGQKRKDSEVHKSRKKKRRKRVAPQPNNDEPASRPRAPPPPPPPIGGGDDECEEDDEDGVSDEEDEADDSPRIGEMYMECVMDAEKKNVTHYVFYFLIKSPGMIPNRRMAALVKGNAKRYAMHRKKSREPEHFHPHESWKHIKCDVDLAKLLGYYMNTDDDTISQIATTYDLHDRRSIVCAEEFFHRSVADSLRATSTGNPAQHIYNYSAGSRFKIIFPEPSFVYKLRTADISPAAVLNRCLPDYQQKVALSTYNVISNAFLREEAKTTLPATMTDDAEMLDWLHKQYGGLDVHKVGSFSGAVEKEHENYDNYDAGLYGKVKSIVEKYRQLMIDAIPKIKRHAPPPSSSRSSFAPHNESSPTSSLTNTGSRQKRRSDGLGLSSGSGISKRKSPSSSSPRRPRNGEQAKKPLRSQSKHLQRLIFLITAQFATDAYDRLCRGAYPGLSPTGETIQKYIQSEELYDRMDHFVGKDKPTDTFHMAHVQRFYTSMKEICYLVQNQNIASLCWKYGMTSYMVDFDNVKNHLMLNAERGGGGKSESIATINRLRIPSTFEPLTHTTLKAWGMDKKQQSDQIFIMDEMSQRDMNAQFDEGERIYKSIMSNNRYAIMFMSLGADGERIGAKRQNEWIISIMATNNETRLFTFTMSPAYQRRWHIISFDEQLGQEADKMIANTQLLQLYETQKTECSDAMKKLQRAFRIEQALTFDTFKLIYIGALQKISQHLSAVFMWCLNDYLPSHNFPAPPPADERYILNLINVEVVLDAVRAVFINDLKSPDDPDRHKPLQIKSADFHQVDRYLYVCVRHIVSAMGEAGDKLLDPFEYDVRVCLRQLLIEKLNTSDYSYIFARHLPSSGSTTRPNSGGGGGGGSSNYSATGQQKTDQEKLDEIDFTYCHFYVTDGLTSLARQIQRLMAENKCSVVPCVDRILYTLIRFTKRPFTRFVNTHHEVGGNEESNLLKNLNLTREEFKKTPLGKMSYIGGRFVLSPACMPRKVFRHRPIPVNAMAARIDPRSKTQIYVVARDFLVDVGKPYKDVLQDFIRHMLSFRYQEKERYAFGVQRNNRDEREVIDIPAAKPDAPIFKLKRYSATTCEDIRAAERLGLDLNEYKTKTRAIVIQTSFDLWACERRNEDTGLIKSAVSPKIYRCDELFADQLQDLRFLNDTNKAYFMGISMNTYHYIESLTPVEIVQKLQETLKRSSTNTAKIQPDVDFDPSVALIYRKPIVDPNAEEEEGGMEGVGGHVRPKEPPLFHWETIIGNNGNRVSYSEYLAQSRGCGFRQLYESIRNSNQRRVVFNHDLNLYKWILPHHGIQDHLYALQRKSRLTRSLEPFYSLTRGTVDENQLPEYRPDSSSPHDDDGDFDGMQIDNQSTPFSPPSSSSSLGAASVNGGIGGNYEEDDLIVDEDYIRACGEEDSFNLDKLIEGTPEDDEEGLLRIMRRNLIGLVDSMEGRMHSDDINPDKEELDGDDLSMMRRGDEEEADEEEEEEEEEEEDDSENEDRPPNNATTCEVDDVIYDIIEGNQH